MVKHTTEPTSMVRWNPLAELTEMRQRMDDLFNKEFNYTPLYRMLPNEPYAFEPVIDCIPTETAVEVFAMLPGFTPEGIKVEVQPTVLVVTGERPPIFETTVTPRVPGWATIKATFAIQYTLPVEVNPNEVKATLQNGVLHLVLPITEKAKTYTVPVKVLPI